MKTNPYIAGNPVGGGDAFIGRADVLRDVLRAIKNPNENGIVLYGQRRIGKTSVLRELETQLPIQRRICFWLNCCWHREKRKKRLRY